MEEFVPNRDFPQYVERMKKSGTYGDHLTLQAAADRFDVNILVLSSRGTDYTRLLTGRSLAASSMTRNSVIILGHYSEDDCAGGHYVVLKALSNLSDVMSTRVSVGAMTMSRTASVGSSQAEQSSCDDVVASTVSTICVDAESTNCATTRQVDEIIHVHREGRHYVHCATCCKHPDIVRMHGHKSRLPAIATESGTVYRQAVVSEHLASLWHKEAVKCDQINKLSAVEISLQAPLNVLISKGNETVANKVGNLMVSVYNDAKRLTLSEHSWPSRVVASQIGNNFIYNEKCSTSDKLDLQYVNPPSHRLFLSCIVSAHYKDILNTLLTSRAVSIRLDG